MHYLMYFQPGNQAARPGAKGRKIQLDSLFVINPNAGPAAGPREPERVIRSTFYGSGWRYEVCHSTHPGHATDLARAGAAAGWQMIVAVGGDGTVNEVARALVGGDCALGILPSGSGNALARALEIPLDLGEACRLLLDCRTLPLDAGMIDGRLFFSTAGIGLDAQVSARYASAGRRGFLAYARATVAALRQRLPETVSVTVDGNELGGKRLSLLTIANTSRFGYGLTIAPGARADDGVLDLCMLEDRGIATLVWHGFRFFNESIAAMPGVTLARGRTMRIERSSPGLLQTDGEVHTAGAVLHAEVVPGVIQVATANVPGRRRRTGSRIQPGS